jgi:hypothetical protein
MGKLVEDKELDMEGYSSSKLQRVGKNEKSEAEEDLQRLSPTKEQLSRGKSFIYT